MKHYEDNCAHNHLPSSDLQPDYVFLDLPQFNQPEMLNCVDLLLDKHIRNGHGNAPCLRTFDYTWTYQELYEKANHHTPAAHKYDTLRNSPKRKHLRYDL